MVRTTIYPAMAFAALALCATDGAAASGAGAAAPPPGDPSTDPAPAAKPPRAQKTGASAAGKGAAIGPDLVTLVIRRGTVHLGKHGETTEHGPGDKIRVPKVEADRLKRLGVATEYSEAPVYDLGPKINGEGEVGAQQTQQNDLGA